MGVVDDDARFDDDDEAMTIARDGRRVSPDEQETVEERTRRDPLKLGPGAEVGGYVIDGELGRGGMGVVYSATHPVIGKRAAIKVLRDDVSKGEITVERFIQEARAVNQIGHPNIIDIFAFGKLPDGRAYHVMDLLVGEPLRARLKRSALHPSEAASVIEEIASALVAAHDKGFVHRDLKPDNVYLVTHEGRWPEVKLLDFGLCKLMPEAEMKSPFRTKTGLMLGTPEYMAPEQAKGIPVDYRTDIYALGVVMFEILTGRRPFATRKSPMETLQAHAVEPPPSLKLLLPQLPDELVQLVEAMLAKNPDERPSLAAVRTVIKRLRSTQLPSRTMAGMEMAAIASGAAPLAPNLPSLGQIGPSALGAAPVLPSMPGGPTFVPPEQQRPSQPSMQPATGYRPPATGPDMRPSQPSMQPMQPMMQRPPSQPPPMSRPSNSSLPPFGGTIQPITNSGLRPSNAPIAATTLGVGMVGTPSQQMLAQQAPAAEAPIKLLPILIGALVAIAIGVGLALALTR